MRSLLCLLVLVLLVPAGASAYKRTAIVDASGRPVDDTCLYWKTRQIPWSPAANLGGNLPDEEAMRALRLSFDEWSAYSCSDLSFVEQAPVAREVGYSERGPNANVVLFRDVPCAEVVPASARCLREGGCGDVYDCWEYEPQLIAVTTTTFSQCTGRIVDADIEMNAAGFHFTTGGGEPCHQGGGDGCVDTDVRNTLVHEVGHLIGLDHSRVTAATMFASAPPGETQKRSLHEDDIAALCDIYPAGEPTWTCAPARPPSQCGEGGSRQGSTTTCSTGGAGLALLGLVPAVLWGRRRRQR